MLRNRRFVLTLILLVIAVIVTISIITGGLNLANMILNALSVLIAIISWLYINPFPHRADAFEEEPLQGTGIFIPGGEEPLSQEQGIFIPKGEEKL